MAKPPYRASEAAALRELLKVLGLSPKQAAEILGVKERDVAMWAAGQPIPGDPRTAWVDVAGPLCDAVQAAAQAAPGYATVSVDDVRRKVSDTAETPRVELK